MELPVAYAESVGLTKETTVCGADGGNCQKCVAGGGDCRLCETCDDIRIKLVPSLAVISF